MTTPEHDNESAQNAATKLATSELDNVRTRRAKLVDRFEEELTMAVLESQTDNTQTVVFLLEAEIITLKIWDETPQTLPTLVSEAITETISGLHEQLSCSIVGADSFVGFVRTMPDKQSIVDLGNRIIATLSNPVEIDGVLHHLSARLGMSVVDDSMRSPGLALENARKALQETSDEQQSVLFSQTIERRREHDAGLEYDLKLAISGGQLDVVYQPIVSLTESRISGVEAFARWTHPELGEILPPQFLTVAERSGTIRQLGEQVLVKAMKSADHWARHDGLTNIVLWVNFSPTEIAYPDFEPMIKSLIQQYPRVQLGLEVAESNIIEERIVSTTLKHLRAFGVRTSVDDFSSKDTAVSRLRTLPFDNVKIGRKLISTLPSNEDDQSIVELLTELGSRSDFTVSAVGVETEEQLALLRSLGVDSAQGYLLARPATAEEIDTLLEATLAT